MLLLCLKTCDKCAVNARVGFYYEKQNNKPTSPERGAYLLQRKVKQMQDENTVKAVDAKTVPAIVLWLFWKNVLKEDADLFSDICRYLLKNKRIRYTDYLKFLDGIV